MTSRPERAWFWLLLLGCLLPGLQVRAESLLGARWQSSAQLERLAERQIRYVAPGVVLLGGDQGNTETLAALGLPVLFSDQAPDGEAYYLADHLDLPLAPQVTLVYTDPAGWALLRLPLSRVAATLDHHHFLWPLPESYSLQGRRGPAAKPAALQALTINHLISAVDPQRLRGHVENLALLDPAQGSGDRANWRTRYARRPETYASTQYIRDQLGASLGEGAVFVEPFRVSVDDSTMYNVVGNLYGTDPEAGYYLVCAHYDAIGARSRGGWDWRVDPAPGADDNASGVALVLEAARVLAGQSFPWSIRFVTFSGEELGLWGSRAYATQAVERDERILGVLNFDMIGFNDRSQRLELVTNPASRWLVEQMRQSNRRYGIGLKVDVLEDEFAGLSDHAPFWARGYDAILGIENYLPTDPETYGVRNGDYRINTQYHSVLDLPDSLNYDLVTRVTQLAVATLGQYGLEEGLPNLAVFTGDLRGDAGDDLQVRISNLGLGRVVDPFEVRVWRCGADSSDCVKVYEQEQVEPLAPGDALDLKIPWDRYGEMVFLVEADAGNQVVEQDEEDNRAYQRVRLVPQRAIVVFPNPFRPEKDSYLSFSGLPFDAQVRISTLQGELVWEADESRQKDQHGRAIAHEVLWDGANSAVGIPRVVGSGVYIYTITDAQGRILRREKIAVVH
ncbi:MAG: M20/M25/M40 family metallo-hydrolase [Candidatus Latescibacteria bacterium]|nr:M20/M25/M40 family metallo-hydrolase [Candidatus Latescibacterota bacterium]